MVTTVIDNDRFVAVFQSKPTVKEINGLVEYAKNSPARIRIIDLTVPLVFQKDNSTWMRMLRRYWTAIGNCKFLLDISQDHLRVHDDPKIAAMRAGLS